MSSVFDRVNPDNLLSSDGEGGYKSPVGDGFVDWDAKTQTYESEDNFVNYNEQTGTYESKDQQKSREQYPTPPLDDGKPYSYPHVRGSAVSVQSKLKNITFVKGTSGGMSGSIAYIRYWSRNGVQRKTSAVTEFANGAPADSQQELSQQLNSSYLAPAGTVNLPAGSSTPTPPPFRTSPPGRAPGGDLPTNTSYRDSQEQPAPTTPAKPSFFNRLGKPLGKLFSANPGNAVDPATAIQSYTYAEAPEPDNAVWQFLFNPEELNLSSGPDYNRAETWGVSDPANSGQPLSWRSNKNRKLTFGKVLLHGYTFGKRVDSLENGLQQLFMARDGNNGSDGPPVLEFVWGQRVFGPCVIQNIQVREQAWDKGLLVNAEVSFELEQVPEWTINDGFVDVVRPGRQSTVNDPFVPSRSENQDGGGGDTRKEEKKNKNGGGNPKPTNTSNPSLCNEYIKQKSNFFNLVKESNPTGFDTNLLGLAKARAEGLWRSYRQNIEYLRRSGIFKEVKETLDREAPGCNTVDFPYDVGEEFIKDSDYVRAIQFTNGCARRVDKFLGDWLNKENKNGGKCESIRRSRIQKEKEDKIKEEKKRCDNYNNGNELCKHSQLGSRLTCNGSPYYCRRWSDGRLKWVGGV